MAAILYSLLESAKLAGIDPERCLHQAVEAALVEQAVPLPQELAVTS